ncbi:MAG: hypothetical protein U0944_01595, partial [Candidatus Moranbacteria bacterium]|nr:hypothetical protein [Candidatus Moranbacteria bacterium]
KKIWLGLFLACVLLSGGNVRAAKLEQLKDVNVTGDFDFGPTSFSIDAAQGETVTKTLQLTNRNGEPQEYIISAEDFQGSENPDQTVLLQGGKIGRYSAKDWVHLEMDKFTTKHGERQFFDVTINIPKEADAGDHYVSVLASATPKVEQKESRVDAKPNVVITSRVGALFFIKVKGKTIEEGSLQSFKANRFWYEKPPVAFKIVSKNEGTVRLRPSGKIVIKNMFGAVVDSVEVKPFNVLRESMRGLDLNWESQKFLVGRYTANLELDRGYGGQADMRSVSFWLIPWKQLGIGLAGLVFFVLLVNFTRKRVDVRIGVKKKRR